MIPNTDYTPIPVRRYFLFALLVVAALKLLFAFKLDLYSDEIFYWEASTHPALAYSDLPFMAALLSGLGTLFFGQSAIAVRSLFLVMGTSIPFLVYWIALPLVPRRQALEAAALSLCMPLGAFLGLLAVPDVPLLFWGLLMIGFLERATRLDSTGLWLAAGFTAAMGVSTHYRFALYILAVLIWLVAYKDLYRQWRRPGLWLAVLLLCTGLYPAVAFNLNNQLGGVDYHLLDRHPWEFQAEGLLHPFKQAVLVTPLLYLALLATLIALSRAAKTGDSRRGLFALLAVVNLGVYFALAPWTDNTRTSIHWPLSGYLPLLVFLPETLRSCHARLLAKYGTVTAKNVLVATVTIGFAGSVIALLGIGSQSLHTQLRPLLGPDVLSNKMAGWKELNQYISEVLQRQSFDRNDLIVTDNYYTGAQLKLGLHDAPRIYNIDTDKAIRDGRAMQYELWNENVSGLEMETGKNALFITEDSALTVPDKTATLASVCAEFEKIEFLEQLALFDGEKAFSFYRGSHVERNSATAQLCPLPSLGWVDQPQPGAIITESPLQVSGWVINEGMGVQNVEVLLNGVSQGYAHYGLPRADVVTAMSVMTDPNSPHLGFDMMLNLSSIASGAIELVIRTTGISGEIQTFGTRDINIRER